MRFSIPETLVLPAEQFGRGIFLAHGNHHGIEAGHERLAEAAKAAGAGIAIFGHTHVPCLEYVNAGPAGFTEKILLLNPGSIGRPRSRIGASFAVLEIPDPISNEAARPRVQFWGLSETRKGYAVRKIDF
jgi:predicted phosphodiesterase